MDFMNWTIIIVWDLKNVCCAYLDSLRDETPINKTKHNIEKREIHMTSNQNKLHVSLLMLAFQLFIASTLILPLTARNIKSSVVNKSNQSEILVIMASGINVTSVYNSFSEFKKMFGVEFPDDRRIAFKQGEGESYEFINFQSITMFLLIHSFFNHIEFLEIFIGAEK
jgi:hypothetical protein